MSSCRKMKGLIAASLYEEQSTIERDMLNAHLASCPACRAETERLRQFTESIPQVEHAPQYDLLPAVRRRLREAPVPRLIGWRWALATAACVLLVASLTLRGDRGNPVPSPVQTAAAPTESPLAATLASAERLVEDRNFAKAAQELAAGLSAHADAPRAGEAQKLFADIAFEHLQWYEEAYGAYRTLADKHATIFMNSPESVRRHNLLDEAVAEDKYFGPLRALDAAKNSGPEAFARLEEVVCDYPGKHIASVAAEEMARLAARDADKASAQTPHLEAMALARARCTTPVATVQLTLEMGLICLEEDRDSAQARALLNEVVEHKHTVLAQRELAHNSLRFLPVP